MAEKWKEGKEAMFGFMFRGRFSWLSVCSLVIVFIVLLAFVFGQGERNDLRAFKFYILFRCGESEIPNKTLNEEVNYVLRYLSTYLSCPL